MSNIIGLKELQEKIVNHLPLPHSRCPNLLYFQFFSVYSIYLYISKLHACTIIISFEILSCELQVSSDLVMLHITET